MNRGEKTLMLVRVWVEKIGQESARKRLAVRDMGFATIDKIVRSDYHSVPGHRITEILLSEMSKDGVLLEGEEAS